MASSTSESLDCSFVLLIVELIADTKAKRFAKVVEDLRLEHNNVRFSTQRNQDGCRSFGIFGQRTWALTAFEAVESQLNVSLKCCIDSLFALHLSLRDLSFEGDTYDDELADALHDRDGVLLGGADDSDNEEFDDAGCYTGTLESVVSRRIGSLLPMGCEIQLFMDDDPFANRRVYFLDSLDEDGPVTMCLVGSLSFWDAAVEVANSCKSVHVPLSERYDVFFWCSERLRFALDDQMHQAVAHWKGSLATLGSGFGLFRAAWSGFSDMAANVSAVLRGSPCPGWRRMVMVPIGAGFVPELRF